MDIEPMNGKQEACFTLIPTLDDSCLIPFLYKELKSATFMNICERAEYYSSIIKLIYELCCPLSVRMLFTSLSEDNTSIYTLVKELLDQAKYYRCYFIT